MGAEPKKKEADPVTEFIRERITQWEDSGRKLKDLAALAGLAKSMPSQIKAKTSAASFYSATKLARPLGFRDLPSLVTAAHVWWADEERKMPKADPAPALTEAIDRALEYGVTREQIDRALKRYPIDQFGDADALWWLSRFHEERSLDQQIRSLEKKALPRVEKWEKTTAKKNSQSEWRGRRKKPADVTVKAPAAVPKRRSKSA